MDTRRTSAVKFGILGLIVLAVVAVLIGGMAPAQQAYAESGGTTLKAQTEQFHVTTDDGFVFDLYDDGGGGSVWLVGYVGSATEIVLPTSVTAPNGLTFIADKNGDFYINKNTFANNTSIQKAAIPDGYHGIGEGAFSGCTGLTELSIGSSVNSIEANAFVGCSNLKTYNINGDNIRQGDIEKSGIGQENSTLGSVYPGVIVYTKSGSTGVKDGIENTINDKSTTGNIITVDPSKADPYSTNTVTPGGGGGQGGGDTPGGDTPGGGGTVDPAKQMGEDGTPLGKGASAVAADNFLTQYGEESDPDGSCYTPLAAKITNVKKNSMKLSWSAGNGAVKYVVYGSPCGKGLKVSKQQEVGATKITIKKVNGQKLKKGTYYKFIVVALDANDNVVSTSKMVHAATKGGKFGNHKKVTTAAKKNKATIKVGKSFKLKAKATPESKKLKVKNHRKIAYESDNPAIATVSNKGVIKGMAKGKCVVYAYAQNGVCAKIKVTVK